MLSYYYVNKDQLTSWLDTGVDGVFLRDTSFLVEDGQLRDEPQSSAGSSSNNEYDYLTHNYTRDLAESTQVVIDIFGGRVTQQQYDDVLFGQKRIMFIV